MLSPAILFIVFHFIIILTINVQAQEGWFWQNPKPQGTTLQDVAVIDENTAIAVGELGTVIRTMDGGNNWEVQNYVGRTPADLYAVHFSNKSIGYAAGVFGTVLKTENGGQSWNLQTTGTPYDLFSISFVSPDTGWVVGFDGTVLKTTDGGKIWFNQDWSTNGELFSVFFISSEIGWVAGNIYPERFWKTVDGGNNWTSIIIPELQNYFAFDVQFLDESLGYLAASSGIILKSIDGGLNWALQQSNTTLAMESISFINPNQGWILTTGGSILHTVDGGDNWILQEKEASLTKAIGFDELGHGWAVGSRGLIYKKATVGFDWSPQSSGRMRSLNDIQFINDSTGWAVGASHRYSGDEATIMKTTDGGNNWLSQRSGNFGTLTAIDLYDETTGWICGYDYRNFSSDIGIILKTNDSGDNWNLTSIENIDRIFDIKFVNENLGWIVGSDGDILKTFDGGSTWASQNSNVLADLWCIEVINKDTIFVGGGDFPNGSILRTIDGGITWESQNVSNSLFSLYSINGSTIWAVGYDGAVFKTIDSGATWTDESSQIGKSLTQFRDVFFSTENNGWIVGADDSGNKPTALLFGTVDGGQTWKKQTQISHSGTTSIHFINDTTGWVVGSHGMILKTNTGGFINASNLPPLVELPDFVLPKDTLLTIQLNQFVADRNNSPDELTWAAEVLNTDSLIVIIDNEDKTAEISTLPNFFSNEAIPVVFTVTDPEGLSDSDTVNITVSGNPTSVNQKEPLHPFEFSLSQNYPNPFNPSTMIEFAIPSSGLVTLNIYNILGKEVDRLINKHLPAGQHQTKWDASSLSTGLYFYRLKFGEQSRIYKMILSK